MATSRMRPDTVYLSNYVGEVNNVASYQVTVLKKCCCVLGIGASVGNNGNQSNDGATLYIFDHGTTATSEDGATARTYLPYDEWAALGDKAPYWTLSDKGKDKIQKVGFEPELKVTRFFRRKKGTRRMWHFEVSAK